MGSTCDRINKDEFLICYGFVTNKYKKYNDSNIIYYSIAILKEIDGGDSHLELYQIKLQKSDFDQVDKNVLLNKPYNVDSVNGKIDLLENVLPSKTSISFQQLLEKYREFPKGEESSQP